MTPASGHSHDSQYIVFTQEGGSIMVGNRYWMPPPRQFQSMFQESISNQTAMLHPVVKIQGGRGGPDSGPMSSLKKPLF